MPNSILEQDFFFTNENNIHIKRISVAKHNFSQNQSIFIPGSKSITNRAVVLAGMSPKPLALYGFLFSEDSYWGLIALQTLGFQIECDFKEKMVSITPPVFLCQNDKGKPRNDNIVYFGKSGTLARFFPAVILNWEKTFAKFNVSPLTATLDGEDQLRKRPLRDLVTAIQTLGGKTSAGSLPLVLSSSSLAGECEVSGRISGQFLSGLLLAAAGAKSHLKIFRKDNLVQPDYIKLTLKMIKEFKGEIFADTELTKFEIFPAAELGLETYRIEADASTACYFICLAYLHNFNLRIMNLGKTTLQPDYNLIYLLQEMGANILVHPSETHVLKRDVPAQSRGHRKIDCSLYSDQALTIGILALFADGPIEISGIGHIRHHECDRISCLIKNFTCLGFEVFEKPDGFIVYPIQKKLSEITGIWETFQDHRFVMAGFLLASLCPGIEIIEPQAVEKTAPRFFEQVQTLGFKIIFHK